MTAVNLRFQVKQTDALEYRVCFSAPGTDELEESFKLVHSSDTQLHSALINIRDQACSADDITYVGQSLWSSLLSTRIGHKVRELFAVTPRPDIHVRLSIHDSLLGLPWESLYEREIGPFALTEKPAFCIVHGPATTLPVEPLREPCSPLNMLILAPERSGLAVSLEVEVIERLAGMRNIVPRVVSSQVTAERIHAILHEQPWDIVHFIGHGRVSAEHRLQLVLNNDNGGEHYFEAEDWSAMFDGTNVRLAVFNCCRSSGATPRPDPLSGIGPLMMRKGIPAVVSMRYDILDRAARVFANAFYNALFNGRCPGRVDLAMNCGRGGLSRVDGNDPRARITPVLHLAEGHEQLFTFTDKQPSPSKAPSLSLSLVANPVTLPKELLASLSERRCVPVIGPGVLRAGMLRFKDQRPLGVSELIHKLALDCEPQYPRRRDLELCSKEQPDDWISASVLQRVCQYFCERPDGWKHLVEKLSRLYRDAAPAEALSTIAQMKVPGLFYLWIDGQLHDAVIRKDCATLDEVIWLFDQDPEAKLPLHSSGRRPLVLVRGSVRDLCTLVVTEDEHERLAVNIASMSPDLRNVAREWKHNVLFFGVSPRDPLVRQLAHQLLEKRTERRRQIQDRSYFISHDHDPVDAAYWHQFGVEWIVQDDLDRMLEAVMKAATAP